MCCCCCCIDDGDVDATGDVVCEIEFDLLIGAVGNGLRAEIVGDIGLATLLVDAVAAAVDDDDAANDVDDANDDDDNELAPPPAT